MFQTGQILQLTQFHHVKYSGPYHVELISETIFHCIMEAFSIHITGKELSVHYMQEDGFFLSCNAIESVRIERL